MRRRWRRARGGAGAGGEGTELNDGEEPIMLRSIDGAVRKRDVVLRNAGRGGGGLAAGCGRRSGPRLR